MAPEDGRSEALLVCGAVGAVLCFTIASLGGAIPHALVDCQIGEVASTTYTFLPAAIPNSPFGGNSSGEGILPYGFPGWPSPPGERWGFGTGALNGTTNVVFFGTDVVIGLLENTSSWGYGTSAPCTERFSVGTQAYYSVGPVGWSVPVVSNLTDIGEADTDNLSSSFAESPVVPIWNNSFYSDNFGVVSTCGTGSLTRTSLTFGLNLTLTFDWNGTAMEIAHSFPFEEKFSYTFPANFGSWDVDNLSADDGPSGGWAFDYVGPCS